MISFQCDKINKSTKANYLIVWSYHKLVIYHTYEGCMSYCGETSFIYKTTKTQLRSVRRALFKIIAIEKEI
jgi:hypothetical protein